MVRTFLQAENRTVACGGGTAVYNPADNTLTLDNAEITEVYTYESEDAYFSYTSGIYVVGDLTIVLEGDNTISGENLAKKFRTASIVVVPSPSKTAAAAA